MFREIKEELKQLTSGTVFIQIRNNIIGKFGIKHLPIEGLNGEMKQVQAGLSESQFQAFRRMAIESLKYKKNLTHGEILFDFTVRQNLLNTSVTFESNYNMANLLPGLGQKVRT